MFHTKSLIFVFCGVIRTLGSRLEGFRSLNALVSVEVTEFKSEI